MFIILILISVRNVDGISIPLADKLVKRFGEKLFTSDSVVFQQPSPGAVWISIKNPDFGILKGKVCSMYFHPTREHSASTKGKFGIKKSIADPCEWAISIQPTHWFFTDKTYYDTL